MRRRTIMIKLEGRQYISDFRHDPSVGADMMKSKCYMTVRERGVGPESRERLIGMWRVKKLKSFAFAKPKFVPGRYQKFKGT
jgi:hypothetical protein